MTDIKLLINSKNVIGEGPLWDVEEQRFYWLDSPSNHIFRATADGREIEQWAVPAVVGSMALRKGGGAVVALATGLHFFDFKTGAVELIGHPEHGMHEIRFNDGKVDHQGRFVVGSYDELSFTPNPAPRPRGSLYRLDANLEITKLIDGGIAVSNGPCFSPNGKIFYFADTFANTVWAFDWSADGTPSNRRVFVQGKAGEGMADGATVDEEGYLWNAWNGAGSGGGGAIRRYAPDGTLDRTITLPSLKVTSLIFGGPKLDTIFVTTMGMSGFPEDRPHDGGVYTVTGLGVRGLPEFRFAG